MKIDQVTFEYAFSAGKVERPSDCERIVRVAARRLGITMTLRQAEEVWEAWSSAACAGWLILQDEDEIVRAIESFVKNRIRQATDSED